MDAMNLKLVDFKIEFGKTETGQILLADEISPDTCRIWDKATNAKTNPLCASEITSSVPCKPRSFRYSKMLSRSLRFRHFES